mgnify:CR=1 FL=1
MKKFTEELTNKEPNRELQSDEYFHDSDHLIYCAKCHTPRQGRYTLQGIHAAHPVQMPAGTL